MQIGLAADHEGFALKQQVLSALRKLDFDCSDYGAYRLVAEDDYPNFVIPLARAVANHEVWRGIAICGSGIGACIAANKVKKVRSGIAHDLFSARQGVADDDMNLMCIGARLVSFGLAMELIQCFLATDFSHAPRHQRRLMEISTLEEMGT